MLVKQKSPNENEKNETQKHINVTDDWQTEHATEKFVEEEKSDSA